MGFTHCKAQDKGYYDPKGMESMRCKTRCRRGRFDLILVKSDKDLLYESKIPLLKR